MIERDTFRRHLQDWVPENPAPRTWPSQRLEWAALASNKKPT